MGLGPIKKKEVVVYWLTDENNIFAALTRDCAMRSYSDLYD